MSVRGEPGDTKYGWLVRAHRSAYLGSEVKQIEVELDRLWATMSDDEKRAEPVVRAEHYLELKAKGLL